MRLRRKTSLSLSQTTPLEEAFCDERYAGREEVFDELDCAGTFKIIFHKEVQLLRVQLSPVQTKLFVTLVEKCNVRFVLGFA